MDSPPRRLADGDTVPVDGFPAETWQERIDRVLIEPTEQLPLVSPVRPFVNYGQEDRTKPRRSWWSA